MHNQVKEYYAKLISFESCFLQQVRLTEILSEVIVNHEGGLQ